MLDRETEPGNMRMSTHVDALGLFGSGLRCRCWGLSCAWGFVNRVLFETMGPFLVSSCKDVVGSFTGFTGFAAIVNLVLFSNPTPPKP